MASIMAMPWNQYLLETRRGSAHAIVARPHPQQAEPVLWTEVLQGGPDVLQRHAQRTLLLCWPDPWSGFDEASLLAEPGEDGPGSAGFSGTAAAVLAAHRGSPGPTMAFIQGPVIRLRATLSVGNWSGMLTVDEC